MAFGFVVSNLDSPFGFWIHRFLIWIRRVAFGFVVSNLDSPFGIWIHQY